MRLFKKNVGRLLIFDLLGQMCAQNGSKIQCKFYIYEFFIPLPRNTQPLHQKHFVM